MLVARQWNHVLATYDGSGKGIGSQACISRQLDPWHVEVLHDNLDGNDPHTGPLRFGRAVSGCKSAPAIALSGFQTVRTCAITSEEAAPMAYEDYVARVVQRPAIAVERSGFSIRCGLLLCSSTMSRCRTLGQADTGIRCGTGAAVEGGRYLAGQRGKSAARVCGRADARRCTTIDRKGYVPRVPHFLPPFPAGVPLDRRGLAQWVVSRE